MPIRMSRLCLVFLVGGMALNLGLISDFSCREIWCEKILLTLVWMDTFEIWKKWVHIRHPLHGVVLG